MMRKTASAAAFECLAHLAAMEGHADCLQFLVNHVTSLLAAVYNVTGWHPVLSVRNDFGHSPLTIAACYHKQAVVKFIEEIFETSDFGKGKLSQLCI